MSPIQTPLPVAVPPTTEVPVPARVTVSQATPPTPQQPLPPTSVAPAGGTGPPLKQLQPPPQLVQSSLPTPLVGAVALPTFLPSLSAQPPVAVPLPVAQPPLAAHVNSPPPAVEPTWWHQHGSGSWCPFSRSDRDNLETAEAAETAGTPSDVVTDGGRCEVSIRERIRRTVYWESKPAPVVRATWFLGHEDSVLSPMSEADAAEIEQQFLMASMAGNWPHRFALRSGGAGGA